LAWASKSGRDRFIEMLSPEAGERILDVGAGKGKVASRVLEASNLAEVYAVDPNEKRVATIRRDFPKVKSSVAGAESLPFPDGYFDKVYTTMALHHFANLDQATREVARVLKPGGVLTVVEVDPSSGRAKLFRFFGRLSGEHMNLMKGDQLAARLGSSSLFAMTHSASLGYAYLIQLTRESQPPP
jgi:ubiquinone/menaquinone biosynthesis C-methylase UbiE